MSRGAGSAAMPPPPSSIQGRDAVPVGSYWGSRGGHADPGPGAGAVGMPAGGGGADEGRGVDSYRRMVYDDLLVSAARRSHGGMDLGALEDNRRQYYENHKALRLEQEREKDRQWEHEKWVHAERQMEAMREADRGHQREHEWERLFRGETERQREVQRRFEDERRELRTDWDQEKRFEREKEEQRAREWDRMRKSEQDRMRRKLDEFKEETDRERRQWAERQLQWEAEKRKYLDDWEEDDKKERSAWEQWYGQLKEEHAARKAKWDKEKADLKKEYLALQDAPMLRSAGGGGGDKEAIQHEDLNPDLVQSKKNWIQRCDKKADDPTAGPETAEELKLLKDAFWVFVRYDSDSDGYLGPDELSTLADALGISSKDELMGVGGGPEVCVAKWLEWFAGRKASGSAAATELETQMKSPEGEASTQAMDETALSELMTSDNSTDAKLQQGVKEMRKAWNYIGIVREQGNQGAAKEQAKGEMEALQSAGFGEKAKEFFTTLEATDEYKESGWGDGELQGVLEDKFAQAAGGRPQISLKDGSFDKMLAVMEITSFTIQERSLTEEVWGDMDSDKFFAWCGARTEGDHGVLQGAGQLKVLLE